MRSASLLLALTLSACGSRSGVLDDFGRGMDAGRGSSDSGPTSSDAGPRCVCGSVPPPTCEGPRTAVRYAEGRCDGAVCFYPPERVACADGATCVDGACEVRGGCDCAPGFVCCSPAQCDPGAPPRCVPDPAPCSDPVGALGCDGRMYGSACAAIDQNVCVDQCDADRAISLGPGVTCAAEGPFDGQLTVLRTGEDFVNFFMPCAVPYPTPDADHHLVIVCEEVCGGRLQITGTRTCADGRTVIEHGVTPAPFPSCESCSIECDIAEVVPTQPIVRSASLGCLAPPCC